MDGLVFKLTSEDRKALASMKDAKAIRELAASHPENPDISGYTDEEILGWVNANRSLLLEDTETEQLTLQEVENVAGGTGSSFEEARIC